MKNPHIHKFKRDSYSTGKKFYYCINGDCTFKIDVKHSLGKMNICHSCGSSFRMNEYSIRAANPKCMDCIKRRTVKKELSNDDIEARVTEQTKQVDSVLDLQSRLKSNPSLIGKTNPATIIEYNPDDEKDTL